MIRSNSSSLFSSFFVGPAGVALLALTACTGGETVGAEATDAVDVTDEVEDSDVDEMEGAATESETDSEEPSSNTDDESDSGPEPEATDEDPAPSPNQPMDTDADESEQETDTPVETDGEESPTDPEPENPVNEPGPVEPTGEVPMFVATGMGGRRVMSCDGGRTWIANQEEASEEQDDAHQTYTPKGLAYGNGTFIFLTGWGTPGTVWVSTNGIDWDPRVLDEGFEVAEYGFGGIGFDGESFILIGSGANVGSNDNGESWSILDVEVPGSDSRAAAAYDGIWASGVDGVVQTRLDGGDWEVLQSCTGQRHMAIGAHGGFAAGLGFLVSVGENGETCARDIESGEDLGAGFYEPLEGWSGRKPSFVGDAIWIAAGLDIHSTVDGVNWESRLIGDGMQFELIAGTIGGPYAGVSSDGDRFYYSDDGETWTQGDGPEGNSLVDLVFGWGSASEACPAP